MAMNQIAPIRNPLLELHVHGQSVWLDYMRRSLITSGELERRVVEDGLTGVTSNPAIFEKAIGASNDYVQAIALLAKGSNPDPGTIFERIAVEDIQKAADVLARVYEACSGTDGFVSLEVSPELAHDTRGTVEEARRLWHELNRHNVMIKVPATEEGLPAIRLLLEEGINVNITLLFDRSVYERVAVAFIEALEARLERGESIEGVASVASFFVSRIDTAVDARITKRLETAQGKERDRLQNLLGKVAIANAKLAYQIYLRQFSGTRWSALRARGAHPQRVLWASTGTKNPHYSDVLYVEQLIGPDTVNTMPPETLDAFRDHGKAQLTLEQGVPDAERVLADLDAAGISLSDITLELIAEGVKKFAEPFNKLLNAVERRIVEANRGADNVFEYRLPGELAQEVEGQLARWYRQGGTHRLWAGDASLWTDDDESSWLGWLGVPRIQLAALAPLRDLTAEVKRDGFTHVLLLGMGGSSLSAELWQATFGKQPGGPDLVLLDSTDPAMLRAAERKIALPSTLFIVSSKSGTTLEPSLFTSYFLERLEQRLGKVEARRRFVAITDPGSPLEEEARAQGFRRVYLGLKNIGGRYSALSNFGCVPAAALGLDVARLLDGAERVQKASAPGVNPPDNSALLLGILLGVCANASIDKLTLVASPGVRGLGAWIEQLIAESTGKAGKGILPVTGEPLGAPEAYGKDRLFAYLRLETGADPSQDAAVDALEAAGKPVLRIHIASLYSLGAELMRWELATAVAGSLLAVNPFDQPDVEASKQATRNLTKDFERTGQLPAERPFFEGDGLQLFSDASNRSALDGALDSMTRSAPQSALRGAAPSAGAYLRAHLARLGEGDYFALLAFLACTPEHERAFEKLRQRVRDAKRTATSVGFGPRFLHSTGQIFKGGSNAGVFLQVTYDPLEDVPIPGQKLSFGVVLSAQARGDLQVMCERGRRVLRVHLGRDLASGLAALERAFDVALG